MMRLNKQQGPLILTILFIASVGLFSYSQKVPIFTVEIYLPKFILLLLACTGILYHLFFRFKFDGIYILCSLLVLIPMSISTCFSINPTVSIRETLRWGQVFAAFLLGSNLLRGLKEVKIIFAVVVLLGLFQILWGLKLFTISSIGEGLITRHFLNPNQLAFYLDLSLPLAAGFFFGTKDPFWKIWWAYCLLLTAVGLYLTYSCGSWAVNGFVLILLTLLFLYQETGKSFFLNFVKKTVFLCFAGLVVLFFISLSVVIFLPGLTETVLKQTESGTLSGLNSRLYYYVTGYHMIEDFPLTGVGGALFQHAAPYYIPFYTPSTLIDTLKMYHLHNTYIHMAAENGLLTFLAFIFFLYQMGKDIVSSLFVLKGEKFWLLASAAGSVFVWLAHGIVDYGNHLIWVEWAILLGLTVGMKRWTDCGKGFTELGPTSSHGSF